MLTFTIFASTDANSFSQAPSKTWPEWIEILSTPSTKTKSNGLPLIGFYSLKNEKAPRCDDNVGLIYALALDYEETYGTPPTLDEFELPFEHFIYSTPSHRNDKPRFRVIIPLGTPIPSSFLSKAYSELLEWVPQSGLDPSSADISRSFYVYTCCPIDHFTLYKKPGSFYQFFEPLLIDTEEFDKWQSKKRIKINGISPGGRNDTLKAQACAAVGLGKSIEETAQEICDYDLRHHNPPLFEDSSEPNFRDGRSALSRAKAFVGRVTKKVKTPNIEIVASVFPTSNEESKPEVDNQICDTPTSGTMPDSLIDSAPPLLRELSEFIYDCSYTQCMPYAIASAISVLSMYKRTRFHMGTLYPNLYIALVGESSKGKTSTSETAEYIIYKLGLSDYTIARPFSPSGLGRALEAHMGEGFWFWDEFGNALQASNSRNAQSHEKGMFGELNRLYSKAGREHKMAQYASEKTKPIILQKAFLTILATGTTGEVQSLISGGTISSGFFPRWLLPCPQSPSSHQLQEKRPDRVPASLSNRLNRLEQLFPNWMDFKSQINIGYSTEAAYVALKFKEPSTEHPELYGKFMENSKKIALCICESKEISFNELFFGMEFTKYCIQFAEKLFLHQKALIDSTPLLRIENQSSFSSILRLFKQHPGIWMTFEQIATNAQMSIKTVQRHMPGLVAQEIVRCKPQETDIAGRPKHLYQLNG